MVETHFESTLVVTILRRLELFDEAVEVVGLRGALLHPRGGDPSARAAELLGLAARMGGQIHVAAHVVFGHPGLRAEQQLGGDLRLKLRRIWTAWSWDRLGDCS